MANIRSPRHGSMQYWPRVRSKRQYAKVKAWSKDSKDAVLGFLGYKTGMTHVMGIDTRKNAATKGEEIVFPVTVIECPPMKIAGIRLYVKKYLRKQPATEILFKLDKELSRQFILPNKTFDISSLDKLNPNDYSDAKLLVYSQPKLAGVGKKRPEFMEIGMSGTVADKIKFAKDNHDRDLHVDKLFKEGEYVDIHAVTTGKGLQGPVKRFGVAFKQHKTEKGVRRVGSLGPWSAMGHIAYRVPRAGQMGYHLRTEFNKQIMKISNKPEEVNPKGAFVNYGNVKSSFILIKGSVAGPQKRAIVFTKPIRLKMQHTIPTITEISRESRQ